MKSKFLNFKLNKVMEANLDTACEKLKMSRSDIGRLALNMLFDAYLDPIDMGRQDITRKIESTQEYVLREQNIMSDNPFTEEQIAKIIEIVASVSR